MSENIVFGRKLLFHRNNIDDSVGTYVTDYVIGVVCFITSSFLLYKVWRHKPADDERLRLAWKQQGDPDKTCTWAPWDWPRPVMTSITMVTYATILLSISYGLMMLLGGFPHQFLQQVTPYEDWRDSWIWLIIWRTAAGFVAVAFPSLLTMLEQTLIQEGIIPAHRLARTIFYGILATAGLFTVFANFYRLGDKHQPYDIEKVYLSFVTCLLLYGIGMLFVVIRVHCCHAGGNRKEDILRMDEAPEERSRSEVRWDLILHCLVPWIMVTGGVFSYMLTPQCSHVLEDQKRLGCPLPYGFNHNAIMHVLQMVAMTVVALAENAAINRRTRLCDATARSEVATDNETESLASTV